MSNTCEYCGKEYEFDGITFKSVEGRFCTYSGNCYGTNFNSNSGFVESITDETIKQSQLQDIRNDSESLKLGILFKSKLKAMNPGIEYDSRITNPEDFYSDEFIRSLFSDELIERYLWRLQNYEDILQELGVFDK